MQPRSYSHGPWTHFNPFPKKSDKGLVMLLLYRCFPVLPMRCQFDVRWRWGFADATTVIWQHIYPLLFPKPRSAESANPIAFYRLIGLRLDAFHINISFSSFLAVETSSLPSTEFTTDLFLLDWADFLPSVHARVTERPGIAGCQPLHLASHYRMGDGQISY